MPENRVPPVLSFPPEEKTHSHVHASTVLTTAGHAASQPTVALSLFPGAPPPGSSFGAAYETFFVCRWQKRLGGKKGWLGLWIPLNC